MTPKQRPIPTPLIARAFTSSSAASLGVSADMLRGKRFEQLHHGVYASRNRQIPSYEFLEEIVLAQARDYLPLLRSREAFSHTTALLLLGTPIAARPELRLTALIPSSAAQGRNVIGHRTRVPFRPILAHKELPCVPPAFALAQCATILSFRELVVAIDHLILPPRRGAPYLEHSRLSSFLQNHTGKGAQKLRAACQVARVGAESRYESLSRFELARMGLDTLELQANLHDLSGKWIGRFDMVDRVRRKIIEYDGEQHRLSRQQYLRDEKKLERARDAGYKVLRLHKEDLAPSELHDTRRELCRFLDVEPRRVPATLQRYFDEPL